LVSDFDVLLFDEPLTGLDNELKLKVIDIVEAYLSKKPAILLWATHEDVQFKQLKYNELFIG